MRALGVCSFPESVTHSLSCPREGEVDVPSSSFVDEKDQRDGMNC